MHLEARTVDTSGFSSCRARAGRAAEDVLDELKACILKAL